MVSVFRTANDRAWAISDQVAQYNKLVGALNNHARPSWLPDSCTHTMLNVHELLNMDTNDEHWTKLWESLWNLNWTLNEKPPLFVVDQQVQSGISAALSLACVNEETHRLAHEELNARTWIVESVDSMIQIMDYIHCM